MKKFLIIVAALRRGEPIVCTPTDALDMFYGSDLQFLFIEDLLVRKSS